MIMYGKHEYPPFDMRTKTNWENYGYRVRKDALPQAKKKNPHVKRYDDLYHASCVYPIRSKAAAARRWSLSMIMAKYRIREWLREKQFVCPDSWITQPLAENITDEIWEWEFLDIRGEPVHFDDNDLDVLHEYAQDLVLMSQEGES